jgi:hypothetical protein
MLHGTRPPTTLEEGIMLELSNQDVHALTQLIADTAILELIRHVDPRYSDLPLLETAMRIAVMREDGVSIIRDAPMSTPFEKKKYT